jgi:hypothetical protein
VTVQGCEFCDQPATLFAVHLAGREHARYICEAERWRFGAAWHVRPSTVLVLDDAYWARQAAYEASGYDPQLPGRQARARARGEWSG